MTAIRKLVQNFTEADIDDEIILMRLDNGELLSLDGTAAAVWRLIDGRRDQSALVEALAEEYIADRRKIADDVRELLAQLQEARLVAEG
jgi:pyrroloquinoline quinone biosynthesis protein D